MEEADDSELQFEWGKKNRVGGTKKDVQFYDSFTFDRVRYSLYDCVYTYNTGEADPYIGKIVKIWEQSNHKKRVKLLWFFHLSEIFNYLGNHEVLQNALFLAYGEGAGFADTNMLEAISAKCSVICTSEDARNPQPSKDAIERAESADHIFYRTFDVGTYTISDKLPDKIAGIEVQSLLNRKEDPVKSLFSKSEVGGSDMKGKEGAGIGSYTLFSSKTLKSEDNKTKIDEPVQATVSSTDKFVEKKHQNEAKHYLLCGSNDPKSKIESRQDAERASDSVASRVDEKVTSAKHKSQSDICSNKPSKKVRWSYGSRDQDDLQKNKQSADANKDGSKWLETITNFQPWDTRVRNANELGKLVLLQNFNRSFTSRDIEDVILIAFNQSVAAKVIPLLPPYQNPHYGQAYVIFKTRDAAEAAVQKIKTEHLMLSDGSPFIASKGMLKVPPKATKFVGHLKSKRPKMKRPDVTPDTIMYEMALDWILLQKKTINSFDRLYKGQRDERKEARKDLKAK